MVRKVNNGFVLYVRNIINMEKLTSSIVLTIAVIIIKNKYNSKSYTRAKRGRNIEKEDDEVLNREIAYVGIRFGFTVFEYKMVSIIHCANNECKTTSGNMGGV